MSTCRCCTVRRATHLLDKALAATYAVNENPANHALGLAVLSLTAPERAALVTDSRWAPGRTLRIAFHEGTSDQREEVIDAAHEWMKYANVEFVEVDSGDAEVRVAFDESGGSWSYVGTEILNVPAGEPTMNLGWPDDYGRTLHELGHTLGLIHEHQNPDGGIKWNVPAVLAYYEGPPNSWSAAEVQDQVLDVYSGNLTNGGYDRGSIMEYPIPAELVLDPSQVVGWNTDLSPKDIAFIASVYPFPPATASTTSPPTSAITDTTTTPTPASPTPPVVTQPPITATPNPGAGMSSFLVLKSWFDMVSGEVNPLQLAAVIAAAEMNAASPSLSVAIDAVRVNATTVFPDEVTRPSLLKSLTMAEALYKMIPGVS